MRRSHNYVPFIAAAKFPATCPETGRAIARGETAAFYRINGKWTAFHVESKNAENVRALEFSRAYCMADSDY